MFSKKKSIFGLLPVFEMISRSQTKLLKTISYKDNCKINYFLKKKWNIYKFTFNCKDCSNRKTDNIFL